MFKSILDRKQSARPRYFGNRATLALMQFVGECKEADVCTRLAMNYDVPLAANIVIQEYLLRIEATVWPESVVYALYSYYQIERRMPTEPEAREYFGSLNLDVASLKNVVIRTELERVGSKLDVSLNFENCTVCLEALTVGLWGLRCKHVYHEDCIRTWLHEHPTCPVCRQDARSAASAAPGHASGLRPSR